MPRTPWFDRRFDFSQNSSAFAGLLQRLTTAPARAARTLAALPESQHAVRVAGTWSLRENVGHLADLEPLWSGRMDDVLAGAPQLRPADLSNRKTWEAGHNDTSTARLLADFEAAREQLMARLRALAPSDLTRAAIHPRLEVPMRIIDLCLFVAEHDDHHLERMTELVAALRPE